MIRHIHLTAVFILVIESTFGLDPPQDVKIVGSDLQWRPPNDDNVLYSLQYKPNSKSEDEWLNVSSHIGTKLKSFRITPEFYGAVFRVRSEKENHISEWQYSNPVQCLNVDSCVPVMNLNVKPEMVQLTLTHMDRSLEKEYGEHVEFNVSYWRKDNRGYPEVQSVIISRNKDIDDLEPWQNYCFQAEYLLFEKPYGNPSEEKCEIIPESPKAERRRAFICSISATLFVLFLCGACIFLLFKHHKKVKQCLQPLHLEIPDHYIEVLQNGFPLEACPSRSCQSLRSYDIITVMEYSNVEENCQKEEQEKRSPA